MNNTELAYSYIKGELTEAGLLSILGSEELVANVVSLAIIIQEEERNKDNN